MLSNYEKYISNKSDLYKYAFSNFFYKLSVIFIPITTGLLIDSITNKDSSSLIKYGILMIVTNLLFLLFMYLRSMYDIKLNDEIQFGLKDDIYKRILYGNYLKVKNNELGSFLQRHNSDVDDMSFLFYEYKIDTFINLLYIISLFIMMLVINIKLSLMLLIVVPLFIYANKKYIPVIENKAMDYMESKEELNTALEKTYNNIHAIHSQRDENNSLKKYINANNLSKKKMFNYYLSDNKYETIVVNGLLNLCNVFVYLFGGFLALNGEISIGSLTAYLIYFGHIWTPIEYFLGFKKKYTKAKVSKDRVDEIINKDIEINKVDKKQFKNISLNNISFNYENKTMFNNLDINFSKGNIYFIKGKNGSGKSTLFNILSGIYKTDIKVKIDEKEINNINDFLYGNIYFVPAEVFNDEGTIFNNLDVSYVTCPIKGHAINDKVDDLSSGEKRLLQLLKSFNREETILIYDEPFNYLDKSHHQEIIKMINKIKKDHIIIISSHNESVLSICDKQLDIDVLKTKY